MVSSLRLLCAGRSRRRMGLTAALTLTVLTLGVAPSGTAATYINWAAYLHDSAHSSQNAQATAITVTNAAGLRSAWHWKPAPATMAGQPGSQLLSSPTVYNGRIYIGANTGVFYALNEATGAVVWSRFLGFVTRKTCGQRGFVSTATVALDPTTGSQVVYVGAPDGYLYALNANNGTVKWRALMEIPSKTVNDYFMWSSPAVSLGRVFLGVSSQCDNPLVGGGLKSFSQATGAPLGVYHSVLAGKVGGSISTSAAVTPDGSSVLVSIGNGPVGTDGISIVKLRATDLARQDGWRVPAAELIPDSDFLGSPTLFAASATTVPTMVGACNKNGIYYALRLSGLSAGPVWRFRAGNPENNGSMCIGAAIWNAATGQLFVPGNDATINGKAYLGSMSKLNPATGVPLWRTGFAGGPVMGSPSLNGSGVIAAATYNLGNTTANRTYLLNASNGAVLNALVTNSPEFAQPVFADSYLLLATQANGLTAYHP